MSSEKKLAQLQTFEEVLERIHSREFLINNLFQFVNGTWACSLRRPPEVGAELTGKSFFEFGYGTTPTRAMKVAFHNATVMERYSHQAAVRKLIRRVV